jgi:hypothetical protein
MRIKIERKITKEDEIWKKSKIILNKINSN